MKQLPRAALVISLLISFSLTDAQSEETTPPLSAGGFTLNSSIENYEFEHLGNYLDEVIFTGLKGFRKGFITYGTCQSPGKILRIKLKYQEKSTSFFNDLLTRYREKFGDNPSFDGDPFGNVKSWKWSFIDEQGRRINLELQHNLRDTDESIGNMVKLSMPELMNEERLCFNRLHDNDDDSVTKPSEGPDHFDWDALIPQ